MSDLALSAMSARLAKLPSDIPPMSTEEEEESKNSLGSLPGSGLGPPAMCASLQLWYKNSRPRSNLKQARKKQKEPNPAFAPISVSSFFGQALQVVVPRRNLDCRVYYTPPGDSQCASTVMVLQHRAGYSGLSFACMAKEITRGECGVLAVDARRHGSNLSPGKTVSTLSSPNEDTDLSIDVLVDDFVDIIISLNCILELGPFSYQTDTSLGSTYEKSNVIQFRLSLITVTAKYMYAYLIGLGSSLV
ncbi:hypothetical protein BDP27DRAFT_1446892 [Rhodocollybia butyracea]|uniref:Protein phosphatase methylesterase-1 n=1 Tax=Rhodocollybia butyracea TaxID=206335 RepID=A0A9P5U932_9AGAR|nr:hypothetical protein BDP27DRAFT_1446892 [Rhodocollybia butyracea]